MCVSMSLQWEWGLPWSIVTSHTIIWVLSDSKEMDEGEKEKSYLKSQQTKYFHLRFRFFVEFHILFNSKKIKFEFLLCSFFVTFVIFFVWWCGWCDDLVGQCLSLITGSRCVWMNWKVTTLMRFCWFSLTFSFTLVTAQNYVVSSNLVVATTFKAAYIPSSSFKKLILLKQ